MAESAQPSLFPLCCMFTVQLVPLPFCLFLRVMYVVVMSLFSFKITNAPLPLSAPSTNNDLDTPALIQVPEMLTFVTPNYNNSPDPINVPLSPPKPLLGSIDHNCTHSYHLSWPLLICIPGCVKRRRQKQLNLEKKRCGSTKGPRKFGMRNTSLCVLDKGLGVIRKSMRKNTTGHARFPKKGLNVIAVSWSRHIQKQTLCSASIKINTCMRLVARTHISHDFQRRHVLR
jgi:hypothetical protein